MTILLTNDDGVEAEGLAALAQALTGLDELRIVAPRHEQSGRGHAITLHQPVKVTALAPGPGGVRRLAVDGTPADAVKFGLQQKRAAKTRLVVSGINPGLNLGVNVLYSGTVGAALEAVVNGLTAVAVSIESVEGKLAHGWEPVTRFARKAVQLALDFEAARRLGKAPDAPICLNLNVPALPAAEIRGLRFTRHGCSGFQEFFTQEEGMPPDEYVLRGSFAVKDPDESYDTAALKAGYATLTPLHIDLTCPEALAYFQESRLP